MHDIQTLPDIQLLVDAFYGKVRRHPLIGPVFEAVVQDNWPHHLEKMYRFWQTVLLEEHTYFGSPFPPHLKMGLEKPHFDAWLGLWKETVGELYEGEKADEALWRADKMAEMFRSKIDFFRNNTAIL
ncbi:group III truncated hemoglobin [Dinghuibacter silviterrae]|uniref:Hemoglobin n=1 Tax=Dinghuibacter silviterrae TaxID=1539049 RepID=A0A4R8DJ83_9BACT|nr:group III truncated hemoglobin [Dinghuibacter silviterrae]TDW97578.1 hemoglobin [Dinghuibacter silviterrae]